MNVDIRTADYINRVVIAIADGTITDGIANWCPECDDIADPDWCADNTYAHVTTIAPNGNTVVILGCESYWVIDPHRVGIVDPNWADADGNPSNHVDDDELADDDVNDGSDDIHIDDAFNRYNDGV